MIRLKQYLALPRIEPRPPCPPKVYKKLFTFLDSALPTNARKSSRRSQKVPLTAKLSSQHVRPDNPAKFVSSRKGKEPIEASASEIPTWTMPVIRQMCKKLGALAAPHHVFAGVSSIFSSSDRPLDLNVVALMITIYLLVLTRLNGVENSQEVYSQRKKDALEAVDKAMIQRGERVECDEASIDTYMLHVKRYKWTDMDWFGNVVVGSGVAQFEDDWEEPQMNIDGADEDDGHILPHLSESFLDSFPEEDFLQAGLGTMMDDRVDYLSDARRRSYERWKRETLLLIDDLEARDQTKDVVES